MSITPSTRFFLACRHNDFSVKFYTKKDNYKQRNQEDNRTYERINV